MKNQSNIMNRILMVFLVLATLLWINGLYASDKPVVEKDKTSTLGTVITQDMLKALPLSRNFQDVLNMVPGVTPGRRGVSIRGGAISDNLFMIDGVQLSNAFHPSYIQNFNLDMVEEIQVQTGGVGAEYGGSMGNVINVITKSGGNKWSGSASLYWTPGALSWDLDEGLRGQGKRFNSYFEPGVTLGGPIVKDKLWFFGSFNFASKETQPTNEDYPPEKHWNMYPNLKFTYQHDELNRFSLSYNYFRNYFDFENTDIDHNYRYTEKTTMPWHSLSGSWQKDFGNGWNANLQTSYFRLDRKYEENREPFEPTTGWNSLDNYSKIKAGNIFGTRLDIMPPPCFCGPRRHQTKFGLELNLTGLSKTEESKDTQTYAYESGGYNYIDKSEYYNTYNIKARMSNFSVYLQDNWTISNNLSANLGFRYDFSKYGWPAFTSGDYKTEKESAFSIHTISPRIGFAYDIKGDGKNVVKGYYGRFYQQARYGWVNNANPMPSWGYSLQSLSENGTIVWDDRTDWHYPSSAEIGYDGSKLKAPYMDELTVGFERKLTDDWSVSLNYMRRCWKNGIHTVDGNQLDMDALMNDGEINWKDYQETTIHYNDQDIMVYNNLDPARVSSWYIVNPPGADRNYDGLELQLNKRYSNGWSLNASYIYSNTRGLISPYKNDQNFGTSSFYQNPNNHINAEGRFMNSHPHQFKIHGTWDAPFGIKLGTSIYLLSGSPYTEKISSDYAPLDGITDGFSKINVESRGDSRLPTFWMLNLGLEKTFKVTDTTTATLFVDGYNITNNDTETRIYPILNDPDKEMGEIQRILNPGLFQFGVRVSF